MQRVATASTREIFGRTLLELGRENPDIVVLGADLNKSTFANLFGAAFTNRYFDLGAAEQNMMSMAAGFAAAGKIPFCTTFAVFGTGRPFDQIRTSIAQPELNVKIVCTHSGITVGEDGKSAHGIEDLALMTALPTFTVISPADAPETVEAVRAAASHRGPVYLRLFRPATPVVHHEPFRFQVGKAEAMRTGSDATVVACGSMVAVALQAAEALQTEGVSCAVLNMSTLQPLDEQAVTAAARDTGAIVTVEEHYLHGGLGSLVASTLVTHRPVPLEMVGLTRYGESGRADQLLERHGLTPSRVAEAVRRVLARKR
ncbi:MAG: transketolase family protein [SAR202 cluster bacterium]|nr:transketolase family protein [SAR202 cluster bacterium]